MDDRYRAIADYVVNHFAVHLGLRLKSAFIKGSVARGEAVWGVSDLDLVLALDTPTEADTTVKREVEESVRGLPGGEVLVIQRIAEDRLQQMSIGVRAYWLYSCWYDSHVLYGAAPSSLLPAPPQGEELARLLAPIIREDGEVELGKPMLNRQESRHLTKRILHGLALPAIAEGRREYVAPLQVSDLSFPPRVKALIPPVIAVYKEARPVANPERLQHVWQVAWDYIAEQGI